VKESLRLASIDIGTNSIRLLVAGCDGEKTETLDRRMVITRLGEGVDETHFLSAAAMERTAVTLSDYRSAMDRLEPAGIRAVATSALRDCRNKDEFLDSAYKVIGRKPDILSGADEASASFIGAVSDIDLDGMDEAGPILVFDIGGGSTEIIVGDHEGIVARSVDVGCVRMSERFLTADPPSPVTVGRMESHIVGVLKPVISEILPPGVSLAVGLAGTVTTLSAMKQGLEVYDTDRIHHSRLSRAEVQGLFVKLASVDVEERKRVMGIEPGRADVIVGGTAVLLAIMDLVGIDEVLVSEKDILDGLVIDLYRQMVGGTEGE
jgi:exopolyphosphatase/guanosine-5'-triphosphate,3'-diphosphate pyrophosphatase